MIVIGGGQAGLAMSFHLSRIGREHLVLERGRVGERWRSERWDSLCFQSPNWLLHLPGHAIGGDPDAFSHHHEVIRFIDAYAARIHAPLRCGVEVRALRRDDATGRFLLDCGAQTLEAREVVIATGPYQRPRIPALADRLPAGVLQFHASSYRNPDQLPPGAVLVVGSGASGCQIAEELNQAGRHVVFSISRHRRVPRRYRGRDLLSWLSELGMLEQTRDQLPAGEIPLPVALTGAGGGHDIDLRTFATAGVRLAGYLSGSDGARLRFEDNVEPILRQADAAAAAFERAVDDHLQRAGAAPAPAPGAPHTTLAPRAPIAGLRELDLGAERVTSVIWCSGYDLDFEWVRLPVFDALGQPLHRRGVTSCAGAHFLGLQWLHAWKSSFLFGVGDDAEHLAECMAARS